MRPRVLILSSLYDFAVDVVVRELARSGVDYLRLNREQFSDLRITLYPADRKLLVKGLGLDAEVDSNLGAIWYRAPVFLRTTQSGNITPSDQLSRSQWSSFLRSMMVFDTARWMNNPVNTYQAECKPFQLKAAHECGFNVPKTLVTNDAAAIHGAFKGAVAIKSTDTVYLRDGEDFLFAYTSIMASEELRDDNTHQVPVIAQRVIRDKVDIRVTVVGSALWAYKITVCGNGIEGDWRKSNREDLEYNEVELPPEVAVRCVHLCRYLHLPFAAIDLVQTREGIFFIEVNPTGEWAWLPGAQGKVGHAIGSWLIG